MRVMLVTPFTNVNQEMQNAPRPKVGDIDEVIDICKNHEGKHYYKLARFGKYYGYQADLFAILPDAEPEAVTEEETLLQTA